MKRQTPELKHLEMFAVVALIKGPFMYLRSQGLFTNTVFFVYIPAAQHEMVQSPFIV